jgi:hypothetical protein
LIPSLALFKRLAKRPAEPVGITQDQTQDQKRHPDSMKKASASAVMDLNFALWRMGFEAQSVIAMRTMGAAGFWNHSDLENQLMLREKQKAFAKGTAGAARALMRGESPAAIMLEAVKPMQRKTGANARRLTKRGPRIPGLVG